MLRGVTVRAEVAVSRWTSGSFVRDREVVLMFQVLAARFVVPAMQPFVQPSNSAYWPAAARDPPASCLPHVFGWFFHINSTSRSLFTLQCNSILFTVGRRLHDNVLSGTAAASARLGSLPSNSPDDSGHFQCLLGARLRTPATHPVSGCEHLAPERLKTETGALAYQQITPTVIDIPPLLEFGS